ncbi:MAG TPA: acyl-ACP thioesterase domain-containing protein [Candidatus Limnocylindrales bacterium]
MQPIPADAAAAERRGITVPYRARFDECGPDGLVRSSALLRYAQDVAWIHSERLGFTRDWYAERNLAWVVRAAELAILAPLPLGETITLSTQVIGFRRVWARRRTEGRLDDGTLALWGHTDWVIIDTVRGMPGRFPPEFLARFDVPPDPFEPGRVTLPPAPPDAVIATQSTVVRPQDIDPMAHVNNAAYLDYLEEAVLAAGGGASALTSAIPRRFRIEYVQAAAAGSTLMSSLWPIAAELGNDGSVGVQPPAGLAWRLVDDEGRELARALVTADAG